MPRERQVRERYVRWLAGWAARWHGSASKSPGAIEIERLALLFADEGMGPWEAVDAATVLVLRRYGRAA